MKDWKKELKDLYNSCGFNHVSNCGCFGECNCVDNLTKLENFINQIISERDKEWYKNLELATTAVSEDGKVRFVRIDEPDFTSRLQTLNK